MINFKLSDREVEDLDPGNTWVEVKIPCHVCGGKGYREVEKKTQTAPGMLVQAIKIDPERGEIYIEGCRTCGAGRDVGSTGRGYLIRHVTLLQLKRMLA